MLKRLSRSNVADTTTRIIEPVAEKLSPKKQGSKSLKIHRQAAWWIVRAARTNTLSGKR